MAATSGPKRMISNSVRSHETRLPAAAVHLVLVELELAGRLLRHPGGRVSLNVG